MQKALIAMSAALLLSGCISSDEGSLSGGADDAGTLSAGTTAAGATDGGAADTGTADTGSTDAGSADSGSTDMSNTDAGSSDSGSTDMSSSDAGSSDSGSADTGSSDAGSSDSGSADMGSTDTGSSDAGSADSGTTDSGSTDTGSTDDGSSDSGATDTGSTDNGSADSGATDNGSTDSGSTDGGLQVSCEVINVQGLINGGGFVRTVLPADLSLPGAQITIQTVGAGQFTAFDSSSGVVDYVPGAGRLPSSVTYQVNDADGAVLALHEHRWVFDPVRVMPLGDSITSGVEFFDGSVDQPTQPLRVGYRKFLYDRLVAGGYAIDYIGQGGQNAGEAAGLVDPQNNGYPGVDIAFIDSKLLEVLAEDSADIILLHIGTNNTPQDAAAIDQLLIKLDTWEAENHPVLVLVATITPKRDATKNAQVDTFNQDLRARIAARVNDNLILVDQNMALSLDDISDEPIGLHPNASGYQKMADAWFDALTKSESTALGKCL